MVNNWTWYQSKSCCTGVGGQWKDKTWEWSEDENLLEKQAKKWSVWTPTNGTFLSWYLLGVHIRQNWWLWRGPGGALPLPLCKDPFLALPCLIHFFRILESMWLAHAQPQTPFLLQSLHSADKWHPLSQSLHSPYWKQPNSVHWSCVLSYSQVPTLKTVIMQRDSPPHWAFHRLQ